VLDGLATSVRFEILDGLYIMFETVAFVRGCLSGGFILYFHSLASVLKSKFAVSSVDTVGDAYRELQTMALPLGAQH
jgi:hypothetical protein